MKKNIGDASVRTEFQDRIGYRYRDEEKLIQALTHRSYVNEQVLMRDKHNERMEFLGDAVLELTVSNYLYRKYNEKTEGKLSKQRAELVCEPSLATCARVLDLGSHLRLGKGEELTGGRERDSILSDALEAIIGSIYLDGGMEAAEPFIQEWILKRLNDKGNFVDHKSRLQELVQDNKNGILRYELLRAEGPDHQKQYTVQVVLNERKLETGCGSSKKAAEQDAAAKSLAFLLREKHV